MSLGDYLRQRLKELGRPKSAAGLARAIGVSDGSSAQTGKRLMADGRLIKASELPAAAAYLEVTPDELMRRIGRTVETGDWVTVEEVEEAAVLLFQEAAKQQRVPDPKKLGRLLRAILEDHNRARLDEQPTDIADTVARVLDYSRRLSA